MSPNFMFVPIYEVFISIYGLPINFSQLLMKPGQQCIWEESNAFAYLTKWDVARYTSSKPQVMNNLQTLHLDYMGHKLNVLHLGVRVTLAKENLTDIFPLLFKMLPSVSLYEIPKCIIGIIQEITIDKYRNYTFRQQNMHWFS